MNPITHALVAWDLAQPLTRNRRDAALVTLAGMIPDADALGIVAELATAGSSRPLNWFSDYHRLLGHNLACGIAIAVVAGLCGRERARTGWLAFLAFHLHLVADLVASRGPDGFAWPIPYLFPFSRDWVVTWSGQLEINAPPVILFTFVLLMVAFRLARDRGFSPLWYLSARADAAFVETLRRRFPLPVGRVCPVEDRPETP